MAARRSTPRGRVKRRAVRDPFTVVAGFLCALEEVIQGAPAQARPALRMYAAHGLRRGAEKYRLDLISEGDVGAEELDLLDAELAEGVAEVRRAYLAQALGGTQPEAEA